MKSLILVTLILGLIPVNLANAKTCSILDNRYNPETKSCTLDINSRPKGSQLLAQNLIMKNDSRFTATVYQLDSSFINITYYYRIRFKQKVVANLIVNVLNTQHPHGGPDGQNIGIAACSYTTKNSIKPTVIIGKESKKIDGYISPNFLTHIDQEFNWQNIILKK
jgi:hypothetical protein